MADYDSDSSGKDDIATNVLLGYASPSPTLDDFSQLGGHPTWHDSETPPDGTLAKCKVCNGLMSLLLQLHGDLPERFPGHERRLYLWTCRRKACRRSEGSVRGFRATRDPRSKKLIKAGASHDVPRPELTFPPLQPTTTTLGETLFGAKSITPSQGNIFAVQGGSDRATLMNSSSNAPAAPKATPPDSLAQTFAEKARISASVPIDPIPSQTQQPWPERSAFPQPYSSRHVDAEMEYLEPTESVVPSNARVDREDEGDSSSAAEIKAAFESSMDKTFQHFADRLEQNAEQILRYEFAGQPLLYSKADVVGKILAIDQHSQAKSNVQIDKSNNGGGSMPRLPRCPNCGSARVFEVQLTPHAIAELEAEDLSIDGMDWGTIILAVCSADCMERGKPDGDVGYLEEWVGVQWEELTDKRRA